MWEIIIALLCVNHPENERVVAYPANSVNFAIKLSDPPRDGK